MGLCFGAQTVLCRREVIGDAEELIAYMIHHNVTVTHFVPSMFNAFLDYYDVSKGAKITSLPAQMQAAIAPLPPTPSLSPPNSTALIHRPI